jgi:hypothetical protein
MNMAKKQGAAHPPFNQVIGGSVFRCVWDPGANQYSCSEIGAAAYRRVAKAAPPAKTGARTRASATAKADVIYQYFVFRCVWDQATNKYSCRAVSVADVPEGTRIFAARAKTGARVARKSPRKRT